MAEKQISILHIEDDHVDRMVVEKVIKKLDITDHLYQANNGEDALNLLRGENGKEKPLLFPSIILLDINMPKMNGLEFLKALRADDNLKWISVFIISTSNDDIDKKEAYDLNVSGYILKPVDLLQFEATFKILGDFWKLCEQP